MAPVASSMPVSRVKSFDFCLAAASEAARDLSFESRWIGGEAGRVVLQLGGAQDSARSLASNRDDEGGAP